MKSLQPFLLIIEIEMSLGETSELLIGDMDQVARVLEEAISMALLQFIGEGGQIVVNRFDIRFPTDS